MRDYDICTYRWDGGNKEGVQNFCWEIYS